MLLFCTVNLTSKIQHDFSQTLTSTLMDQIEIKTEINITPYDPIIMLNKTKKVQNIQHPRQPTSRICTTHKLLALKIETASVCTH